VLVEKGDLRFHFFLFVCFFTRMLKLCWACCWLLLSFLISRLCLPARVLTLNAFFRCEGLGMGVFVFINTPFFAIVAALQDLWRICVF